MERSALIERLILHGMYDYGELTAEFFVDSINLASNVDDVYHIINIELSKEDALQLAMKILLYYT